MISDSGNLIFYRAQTQYENLGDIVINKTLVKRLRNYGRLIVDDIGVPDWYCKELELTSEERASQYGYEGYGERFTLFILLFRFMALLKGQWINKIYLVKSLGHDAMGIRLLNSIQMVLDSFLLKIFGVRIVRFGVSIGPFTRRRQIVEKWNSKFMYFYSVRDSISADYARQIGIKQVELFPDLAWLMEMPKISNVPLVKVEDDYVIFSFRKHPISGTESDECLVKHNENLFAVLDEIVKFVCREWSKKLVICYQVTRDREFCKEISERYLHSYDVVFLENQIDSQSMQDLYSRASMIFSNRLHVLMFAMACGSFPVAVVDVAKQYKIAGLFSDAGLMRCVMDINKGIYEVDVLSKLVGEANQIKEDIGLCYQRRRQEGEELLKHIMTGKI